MDIFILLTTRFTTMHLGGELEWYGPWEVDFNLSLQDMD